jgi:voltage-gated potassium channel
MLNLILLVRRFFRAFFRSLKDPQFHALTLLIVTLLGSGTLFYHSVEHWSVLDSFYFTVVTLATVGYGDFTPQTTLGKIFTVLYIFVGVGTLLSFITVVARNALEQDFFYKRQEKSKSFKPSRDVRSEKSSK